MLKSFADTPVGYEEPVQLIFTLQLCASALRKLSHEVETKHAVPELGVWRGSKWLRPDGKMILLSSCASIDGDICSSVAKYELIDKNQVIQTEIEEYKIKIYEPGSLLELLKSIGFRDVKILKAFDRSNGPGDSDENVVYECRK